MIKDVTFYETVSKVPEISYPCLRRHNAGTVVLFVGPGAGILIKGDKFTPGIYSHTWSQFDKDWTIISGSVKLDFEV